MPSDEQIAELRSMLIADATPGAMAASDRLEELGDWHSVSRSWEAALAKAVTDLEGAITATRTTLESVCKHICDERSAPYEHGWDLSRLYRAACSVMELALDHSEQIIKQILSGSDGGERAGGDENTLSDAHGKGKHSVRPAPRHAKLAMNAGFAVAGFLIDSHVSPSRTRATSTRGPSIVAGKRTTGSDARRR
jgi:hypothetical protein